MFDSKRVFSSYAVKDIEQARRFYGQTLGLAVSDVPGMQGLIQLSIAGGARVMVYPKPDHTPATFTVLNIAVDDVERAVAALGERGVKMEIYADGPVKTDARGISRGNGGPTIAWFRDPSGNILSVVEQKNG